MLLDRIVKFFTSLKLTVVCLVLGLVLVFLIVVYNTVHRLLVGAPFLKGLGRFWLYILGASVGEQGVTGSVMWCGLALAAYVAGLVYLARWEGKPGQAQYRSRTQRLHPDGREEKGLEWNDISRQDGREDSAVADRNRYPRLPRDQQIRTHDQHE